MSEMLAHKCFGLGLVSILLATCSCICADGVFIYHISLDLHDAAGQPLANTKFIVAGFPIDDPRNLDVSLLPFTDAAGHGLFDASSGLAWGGCGPIWSIGPAPIPPNPEILHLWVQTAEGSWIEQDLTVPDSAIMGQARGELTIDLGTVTVTGTTTLPA